MRRIILLHAFVTVTFIVFVISLALSHGQMFSARELSCSCLPAAFDLKRLEVFVGTNPVGHMTGLLERLNSRVIMASGNTYEVKA